jgi:hypothetical protein
MRINIEKLKSNAINRPSGYLEDVLSKGIVNGNYLEITPAMYREMLMKYDTNRIRGLGDLVAKVAQPIAHVIDQVTGTHIAGCRGCKQRQNKLNQLLPF